LTRGIGSTDRADGRAAKNTKHCTLRIGQNAKAEIDCRKGPLRLAFCLRRECSTMMRDSPLLADVRLMRSRIADVASNVLHMRLLRLDSAVRDVRFLRQGWQKVAALGLIVDGPSSTEAV